MLSLDRRVRQSILIGEDILIKILNIGTSKVTIGIEAPKECKILRVELIDKQRKKLVGQSK